MKSKEALTKKEIGIKYGLMMHDPIQAHHIEQAMDEYAKQEAVAALESKSSPQQPIPQDINIGAEAEKFANRPEFKSILLKLDAVGVPREGILAVMEAAFNAGAQLLLPELQQLREEVKYLNYDIEFNIELLFNIELRLKKIQEQQTEIEQQKSQIEELERDHKIAMELAEEEAAKQAAEIESLKQENERLKQKHHETKRATGFNTDRFE